MNKIKSIVVEGADNTGKTTLARYLSSYFGLPYIAAGPPPRRLDLIKSCCDYQWQWMLERPCVFDRITPISHQIYHNFMSSQVKDMLDEYMIKMRKKCIIIYCTKVLGESYEDYESEEDRQLVLAQQEKIMSKYEDFMVGQADIVFDGQDHHEIATKIQYWRQAS